MQGNRENRDDSMHSSGPFDGFGAQRSMMSSIFGGRDPFDDPLFTRPFGSMSGSGTFDTIALFGDSAQVSRSNGPVIEELDTSDEGEEEGYDTIATDKKYEAGKITWSAKVLLLSILMIEIMRSSARTSLIGLTLTGCKENSPRLGWWFLQFQSSKQGEEYCRGW